MLFTLKGNTSLFCNLTAISLLVGYWSMHGVKSAYILCIVKAARGPQLSTNVCTTLCVLLCETFHQWASTGGHSKWGGSPTPPSLLLLLLAGAPTNLACAVSRTLSLARFPHANTACWQASLKITAPENWTVLLQVFVVTKKKLNFSCYSLSLNIIILILTLLLQFFTNPTAAASAMILLCTADFLNNSSVFCFPKESKIWTFLVSSWTSDVLTVCVHHSFSANFL